MISLTVEAASVKELRKTLTDIANLPSAVLAYAGAVDPMQNETAYQSHEEHLEEARQDETPVTETSPPLVSDELATSESGAGEDTPPEPEAEPEGIATDEVRQRVLAAVKAAGASEVEAVVAKFAPKLSEVKPEDYAELLRQVAEL